MEDSDIQPKRGKRDICFLIGAGVSQAAGLPSGKKITDTVLNGEGIQSDDIGGFCIPSPNGAWPEGHNEEVLRVTKFLRVLFEVVGEYQTIDYNPKPSFEDLFFLVDQMYSVICGEYENPAILNFMRCLNKKTSHIIDDTENQIDLYELVKSAERYIRDVAANLVSIGDYDSSKCHTAILEAIKSKNTIDIFSLNFDLILEHSLESNDIPFTRGFEKSDNSIRFWNPSVFENNPENVRLFKLHGSVDWLWRPIVTSLRETNRVSIKNTDQNITENNSTTTKTPLFDGPVILVGTINKLIEYNNNVYSDLKCLFWTTLRNRDILIITGYSFRDKGINNQIMNWFDNDNKKIIVIHPEFEELVGSSRPLIRDLFPTSPKNKLGKIEKPIEDVSWLEIEQKITEMQK